MSLPDYKDDPVAYEREETARPDEMAMINDVTSTVISHLDTRPFSRVLDLCCGTGLPLIDIATHPHVANLLGVDISESYLEFAKSRFASVPNARFMLHDAVTAPLQEASWDIVIMASAYHHVDDDRKQIFLHKVRKLLADDGVVVVGENILPPYDYASKISYADAVRLFYREVLQTAERDRPLPPDIRGLIERVAQYGVDGEYEYKTDLQRFLEFLGAANLEIHAVRKVWPFSGPLAMTTGGNYVFTLLRK